MVATFEQKKNFTVVGTRPIRHDGLEKVTGRAVYGADVKLPGLIWGDVLRTEQVHARIVSIDTSEAEAMPGRFCGYDAQRFSDGRGHGSRDRRRGLELEAHARQRDGLRQGAI